MIVKPSSVAGALRGGESGIDHVRNSSSDEPQQDAIIRSELGHLMTKLMAHLKACAVEEPMRAAS